MKALVVDDSGTIRTILVKYLAELGLLEVDQAADGDEAVTLAEANPYCVVLLDWHMPRMQGIDALRKIRESGNSVPVVMVTTEAEKKNMLQAIKAGATDYVLKPFVKDVLQARVRKILARGQPQG